MVLHQNHLFMKLYKIACPHFTEDRTLSLRDAKQDYVNLSNVQIYLTHKEYDTAFMRVMQPLVSDAVPEAFYGNLFIQGLTPALKKRVGVSFSEHYDVTAMTCCKQVDILHNAMADTALCVVEEEVVTDLIADRTQGLLNMVQVVANNTGIVLPPSIFEGSQGSASSVGKHFGQVMPAQNYQIRPYGVRNQNEAFLHGGKNKCWGCENPNPPPNDLHKSRCFPGWMNNKFVVSLHK